MRADLARARAEGATDALTSLPNRRAFDERLGEAISVASIQRQPLWLAFCDIDHFKTFNDTWGHKLGDQVLRLVGGQLARSFRDNGFPARLGGEEFVVLLPGFGSADALEAMREFCALIAARTIRSRTDNRDIGRITISIGVTTLRRGEQADAFDAIMYQAKQQGRNRVLAGV